MLKDKFDVLIREIREVGKKTQENTEAITRIENDLAGDRRDINNFIVKLETVDSRSKQFEGTLARFQTKLKEAAQVSIAEAVEPVINATEDLTRVLKKKQTVRVPMLTEGLWHKLKRLFGGEGVK